MKKVVIVSGTVFGTSEEVAYAAEEMLQAQGIDVEYNNRVTYQQLAASEAEVLLVVTSTTGMGELPGALNVLVHELQDMPPQWAIKQGAIIALGDASYGETFCAGGEQVREMFAELGITELQPMLRLDSSATVTPELDAVPWIEQLISLLQA
ncbi:flavodoxin [Thiopseudomonas alkaliphila]|uniref:flavodoxin domain-containing protein n=1 Tax=Thiopseudomonas alkaliphila TaxID=1697053 RepID=UPI00069EF8FB|nr:flavodoxin domain-containing protein [Thiopseudomonas alkaliphila]AKX43896.1 flavodoxin [Thiopseudomonas alkaliphila]AKX46173.1 flavodoxin [Thiopseudomonas alkaliphila]AKX49249.1 flavodoxin [Thiopseudomonas alkaliphila]AKX52844.1 flavodoxin [Thiopseudomonas alkaliphila]AKX56168.1 flavodoxin [Thiopseudomonas alkaliphila]